VTRTARLCAALLAAALLANCASPQLTPFLPGPETARPALIESSLGEFENFDQRPRPASRTTGEEANYRIEALALPSVGENGQPGNLITARYYQSKRAGAKPLVIVLPIWGMQTYPSGIISTAINAMRAYPANTMSEGLRANSAGAVNVLQILAEGPLFDMKAIGEARDQAQFLRMLSRMVGRFVDTVIDIRRVVDWAQSQPDVDPDRIALIGFSISALVGSVVIANEPRLAAGVLMMGGADLHEILAACNQEIEDARESVLKRFGWSLDQFKRALEPALAVINPARFAGVADPSRVLIIEAGHDTCVPESARERLWRAFGRPERITYPYDHRMTFLEMTFLGRYDVEHQVYRFLDQKFAEPRGNLLLTQGAGQSPRGIAPRWGPPT
jgi:dienelactone hydrolase